MKPDAPKKMGPQELNKHICAFIKLVKVIRLGIEPRTFWTYTKCSNQLSYPAIPWRTSFSMIPQTIKGEQPCAQISKSDSPCRPYVNLVTA